MTNREHILKLIAGLDDADLYDVYECLPESVQNRQPIIDPCRSCSWRDGEDCYSDWKACNDHTARWMAAEVQFR